MRKSDDNRNILKCFTAVIEDNFLFNGLVNSNGYHKLNLQPSDRLFLTVQDISLAAWVRQVGYKKGNPY